MYEATFSVADGGAYTTPTADADCHVALWCNEHCDLLHVGGSETERVREQIREDVGIAESLRDGDELVVVTDSCLKRHETTIERYLRRHDCLLVPPLRYEGGRKHCRILALTSTALTGVYRDLVDDGYDVDVRAKREVDVPSTDAPLLTPESVLPEFTEKQRRALLSAHDRGYYELPRETTTADVAADLGVQRRTAEDHLRRAERKLVRAIVPYLE